MTKTRVAVSTDEVREAATPLARDGLLYILKEIAPIQDRDEQLIKLEELRKEANPETQRFLDLSGRREKDHFELMKWILDLLDVEEMKDRDQRLPEHDHSKDELFYFASACFFDGGITGDEITKLKDREMRRHHTLEPHHPEYEKYNSDGAECTNADIVEMGIDRLCRNAQYGDGVVHLDKVKNFTPVFHRGDVPAKVQIFVDAIEKYQNLVQKEFYKMFPNTKKWCKNGSSHKRKSIKCNIV